MAEVGAEVAAVGAVLVRAAVGEDVRVQRWRGRRQRRRGAVGDCICEQRVQQPTTSPTSASTKRAKSLIGTLVDSLRLLWPWLSKCVPSHVRAGLGRLSLGARRLGRRRRRRWRRGRRLAGVGRAAAAARARVHATQRTDARVVAQVAGRRVHAKRLEVAHVWVDVHKALARGVRRAQAQQLSATLVNTLPALGVASAPLGASPCTIWFWPRNLAKLLASQIPRGRGRRRRSRRRRRRGWRGGGDGGVGGGGGGGSGCGDGGEGGGLGGGDGGGGLGGGEGAATEGGLGGGLGGGEGGGTGGGDGVTREGADSGGGDGGGKGGGGELVGGWSMATLEMRAPA